MATGAAGLAAAGAEEVSAATDLDHLAVVDATEGLAVQWVTESSDGGDLAAVNAALERSVDNHGALRVAREDDIGLGALLKGLVGELNHLVGTRATACLSVASCGSRVVDTLDGEITAEAGLERAGETRTNDKTHGSGLTCAASEDESVALALAGDNVVAGARAATETTKTTKSSETARSSAAAETTETAEASKTAGARARVTTGAGSRVTARASETTEAWETARSSAATETAETWETARAARTTKTWEATGAEATSGHGETT